MPGELLIALLGGGRIARDNVPATEIGGGQLSVSRSLMVGSLGQTAIGSNRAQAPVFRGKVVIRHAQVRAATTLSGFQAQYSKVLQEKLK